jgi:hypothetical protein
MGLINELALALMVYLLAWLALEGDVDTYLSHMSRFIMTST